MNSVIATIGCVLCFALGSPNASAAEAASGYDIGLPHPRTNVPYTQALEDAQAIADQNPDWVVARCLGYSMSPFFTERSVLLVKKLPFEQLRSGMVAVYTDSEGDLVAHKVVSRDKNGWHCNAYQNESQDPTSVTSENFHGIVFAVFNAESGPQPDLVAGLPSSVIAVMGKHYESPAEL